MTISFFTVVVLLVGLTTSRIGAVYWQLVFCLFGAAAAIALPALGGAVITPSVLFLPFLIARAWSEQHGRRYSRRVPSAAVWLGLAVIFGLIGAYFWPRLFAGELEIMTVDRSTGNEAAMLYPLRPVSGNITQSGYAIGAVLAFLSMRSLLERGERLVHYRDAVLLLASLDCAAAALNLAEHHLGLPKILDYVRTAYSLFDTYEMGGVGLIRIHGTFPETSAFCAFTLPLFAFAFSLWLDRVRPWYSGTLAALLLGCLLISTSTTAYVGLALYGAMLIFVLAHRGYVRGTVPRFGLLVAGALLAIVLAGSPFVLETQLAQRVQDYFQITVFGKLESDSGAERSAWNRQAWSNFLDTYGLGVGLGSARASSLPLVLLSNLGLFGTLCYGAFLLRVLNPNRQVGTSDPIPDASRQAILAALAGALVSCTIFDLGIAFYAFAAAASLPLTAAARSYRYAAPNLHAERLRSA